MLVLLEEHQSRQHSNSRNSKQHQMAHLGFLVPRPHEIFQADSRVQAPEATAQNANAWGCSIPAACPAEVYKSILGHHQLHGWRFAIDCFVWSPFLQKGRKEKHQKTPESLNVSAPNVQPCSSPVQMTILLQHCESRAQSQLDREHGKFCNTLQMQDSPDIANVLCHYVELMSCV